jgi:hypothetical protein
MQIKMRMDTSFKQAPFLVWCCHCQCCLREDVGESSEAAASSQEPLCSPLRGELILNIAQYILVRRHQDSAMSLTLKQRYTKRVEKTVFPALYKGISHWRGKHTVFCL